MSQSFAYFDRLIDAFENGRTGRCSHLGHWDLRPDGIPDVRPEITFQMAQQRMDDVMLELANLKSGQFVLDIGCGLGGLIERIDSRFSGLQLSGINVDPRQLDVCQRLRSKAENVIRWHEADACDLSFENNSFDTVFCVEAMFHFDSRARFLEQALRVLKPGGRLVMSDIVLLDSPHISSTPRFMIEAILNDGYGPWPDPWALQGTSADICQRLGSARVQSFDATTQTLPTYEYIIPQKHTDHRDPGDASSRAAMLLRWLHRNGGLRYEYVTAIKT
jgi:SAM-dependent methyltransferase